MDYFNSEKAKEKMKNKGCQKFIPHLILYMNETSLKIWKIFLTISLVIVFFGFIKCGIAMAAITYDSANNKIIIVGDSTCGDSSSNPCTFEDIYQADVNGGWGVVNKQDDNQYEITCGLQIGNGTTETWLIDTNKEISFTGLVAGFDVKNNGHFRLGEIVDEIDRTTTNGCYLYLASPYGYNMIRLYGNAALELFSSILNGKDDIKIEMNSDGNRINIWNSLLLHTYTSVNGGIAKADLYRVTVQQTLGILLNFLYGNDIFITDSDVGLRLSNVVSPLTVANVRMINEATSIQCSWVDADVYVVNTECKWIFEWTSSSGKVYRQYTFNLKVVDKAGTPIPGASVKIWDKNNNLVVDETTDSNGQIPEQTLTYGYYDQDHGNTPVMQTPHKIRVSHQNYPSREFEFTVDKKIDWTIALKDKPTSAGSIKVWGTEYASDEPGTIYAQVFYGDGSPCNTLASSSITATVYKSDGTKIIDGAQMTYVTGSNGIYKYDFPANTFSEEGVYVIDVMASSTDPNITAYNSNEIHISKSANLVSQNLDQKVSEVASSVWNYSGRSLDNINNIITGIWNAATSTMTTTGSIGKLIVENLDDKISNIAQSVWSYTGSALDTVGNAIAKVWNYTTRKLTSRQIGENEYIAGVSSSSTVSQVASSEQAENIQNSVSDLQKQWTVYLSDFGEVLAGNTYRAKLWVLNYKSVPTDPISVPTITIYDSLRNIVVQDVAMTKLSNGIFEYTYTIPAFANQGIWESSVSVDVGEKEPIKVGDYFKVKAAPTEVRINEITDTVIPEISASVTIKNEGGADYEYQYEYCIVKEQSNQCGGSNDIAYASGSKLVKAGESWTTDLSLSVPSAGDYWFKISATWGSQTSGASKLFRAITEMESIERILKEQEKLKGDVSIIEGTISDISSKLSGIESNLSGLEKKISTLSVAPAPVRRYYIPRRVSTPTPISWKPKLRIRLETR